MLFSTLEVLGDFTTFEYFNTLVPKLYFEQSSNLVDLLAKNFNMPRPIPLVVALLSMVAVILAVLTAMAGYKPGFMEDYHVITVPISPHRLLTIH